MFPLASCVPKIFLPATAALSYTEKVLALNPIAYWTGAEAAGATHPSAVNSPTMDGVHESPPTLGQTGIGDGLTSIYYSGIFGSNGLTRYPAALVGNDNWHDAAGSISTWFKCGTPTETDVSFFRFWQCSGDWDSMVGVYYQRDAFFGIWQYGDGESTAYQWLFQQPPDTNWHHIVIAWNAEVGIACYFDGVKQGPTEEYLTMATKPDAGNSFSGEGASPFYQAHTAFFDYMLSGEQIMSIATV